MLNSTQVEDHRTRNRYLGAIHSRKFPNCIRARVPFKTISTTGYTTVEHYTPRLRKYRALLYRRGSSSRMVSDVCRKLAGPIRITIRGTLVHFAIAALSIPLESSLKPTTTFVRCNNPASRSGRVNRWNMTIRADDGFPIAAMFQLRASRFLPLTDGSLNRFLADLGVDNVAFAEGLVTS